MNSKLLIVFVIALLALSSIGCMTVIPPGHVGVVVNMSGDNRGVDQLPLTTGRVFYNPWTEQVYNYPTFVQTAVWTRDANEGSPNNEEVTFNTAEGLTVAGDISLSYMLRPDSVPAFYVKFRNDDLNAFTHGYLRNVARDIFNEVAGKFTVEQLYGPAKDTFLTEVRAKINHEIASSGVVLEQFGFIGAPRPPQSIVDAINSKIQATQLAMQKENELRQAEANARITITRAQADAEANRLLSQSVTPTLVAWKQLEIQAAQVAKWDGKYPTTLAGNSGIMLQMPSN